MRRDPLAGQTLGFVYLFASHPNIRAGLVSGGHVNRLFGPHGHIPPAEYEALHSSPQMAQPEPLILNETSLRWSRRDSILFLGLAGDIPFGFRHCTSPVWLGRCSNA